MVLRSACCANLLKLSTSVSINTRNAFTFKVEESSILFDDDDDDDDNSVLCEVTNDECSVCVCAICLITSEMTALSYKPASLGQISV